MKKITLFCDKCKKEVQYLNHYTFPGYKQEIITFRGQQIPHLVEADIEVEICDKCTWKIREEFNFRQN